VRLIRIPGVYRPQADTHLLAAALREARIAPGARVLDLCTGSGAIAVAAACNGAGEVIAVDVCRRAVLTATLNARLRRLPVRVYLGDALGGMLGTPFDAVLANPPYVPCASDGSPARGAARAWDAGPDGRRFLDPLCTAAPRLLASGGTLLLVHSCLCGPERTLAQLRDNGLKASVVARSVQPFGPVLRERSDFLERAGLIAPGQRHEELVVIRADRIDHAEQRHAS
jgi:release factor glutamine methyltransferase